MECRVAKKLLSAYQDDELAVEMRSSVWQHVQGCPQCGEELTLFGKLSAMAKGLSDPVPPDGIWAAIEAGLDAQKPGAPVAQPAAPGRSARNRTVLDRLLATAAVVLIAVGTALIVENAWHGSGHPGQMASDFGEYLKQFPNNPDRAQKVLLAKYDGQAVDFTQAARQVGYRPAVAAAGLPKRYTIDGVYVLKMPCCTCVQTICRRDDGKTFAIFEHAEAAPAWFGNQPRIDTKCNGCACSLIQAGHGLVVSWEANKRHLTVVGAQDLEEVADLITHFQSDAPPA
jgi:anti-sigma factor RsiW